MNKHHIVRLLLLFLIVLFVAGSLGVAQKSAEDTFRDLLQNDDLRDLRDLTDDEKAAVGVACIIVAAVALLGLIINILILVWVGKDAKARGESAALWIILCLFLGLIGLLIWLLARPKGMVVPCKECGNKRLQAAKVCPQCGSE